VLPFNMVSVGHFDQAPFGSIGWAADRPDETFLIGEDTSGPMAVGISDAGVTSVATWAMGCNGCFVADIRFEVDPASYTPFANAPSTIGALIFARGEVRIGTPSPIGRPTTLKIGKADFTGPDDLASAFRRWRVVTSIGDATHVLFKRT